MSGYLKTPQVHVRVAERRKFDVELKGEFLVEKTGNVTRYTPFASDARFIAGNVPIGIEFHWSQNAVFSLPGMVEVTAFEDGTKNLDNFLDVETYLTSVISSEMNPDAPEEFLKAHAVISRSWLMGKLAGAHPSASDEKIHTPDTVIDWVDTGDHHGFDVCADDHCQRYQGDARVNEVARKAVEETRGIILADKTGKVADARFSKCCGGRSERFSTCWQPVDFDYLTPVDDPFCDLSKLSEEERRKVMETILVSYDRATQDFHDWKAEVEASDVEKRLTERYGFRTGRILDLQPGERGDSGRLRTLRIVAENGVFIIGKELAIRRLLSDSCLYSSWFDIARRGSRFHLTGHGWGHGVGLCQIGAAVMALQGYDHRHILFYYYPTTQLLKIYE